MSNINRKPRLLRITTVPISLRHLITGQLKFAKENGFEVFMASADGDIRKEVMEIEQLDHHILPYKRDISIWNDIKSLWATIKYIKKVKPDIIHTHTPKAGLMGMLAGKICNVPIRIHTVAGMPLEGLTGFKKKIVTFTEKLTYWAANHVWPNSNSLIKFIQKNKFTSDKKLDIIGLGSSNGIDLTDYNPENINLDILSTVKQQIQFDSANTYFLFVGRIVSQKGVNEMVTIFKDLLPKNPEIRLVLVGPFEDERDPISDSTRQSIHQTPEIISVGYSNKVKYFMKLADFLLFPSHREGFPNVPMQAGAMKCPVICSRVTGNIDIVTHKKTGLIHLPKDTIDLKKNIQYALSNQEEMNAMANQHFKIIQQKFSRTYVQQQIILNYKKLLDGKGISNKIQIKQ